MPTDRRVIAGYYSVIESLIGPVAGLLDKFIEDKATMSERHAQELAKGQLEVNKIEAASKSLFVAGWRPAVGWSCCFALVYSTIFSPILSIWFTVPPVDSSLLTTVLMGMLGLGVMRSAEKIKKVSREK